MPNCPTLKSMSLFLMLCLHIMPAWAAQKVALVIGNSQYQIVGDSLKNPVNDAKAVAARLKELGYDTELLTNASLNNMLDALGRVSARLDHGGTVVFYYAGHGMQLSGQNLLVPVDARMVDRSRAEREAVRLQEVVERLDESGAGAKIIVVDACRNDPFPKTYRSGSRGLARMEGQLPTKGLMVLYAASPGEVAADGSGAHGTFTEALLSGLRQGGQKLPELMEDISDQVQKVSGGRQHPYYEGTGLARLVLVPEAKPSPVVTPVLPDAELVYWDSIKSSTDASDYAAYLQDYPRGRFAGLAKNRQQQYAPKPVEPSPTPVQLAQVQVRDKLTPQAEKPSTDEQLLAQGQWRDPQTNLIWMRCSVGQFWNGKTCTGEAKKYNWQEALDAAIAFNNDGGFGGYKDWGVPHMEDLSAIRYCSTGFEVTKSIPAKAGGSKTVDLWCKGNNYQHPAINQTIFPKTKDDWYWSSVSFNRGHVNAWAVNFLNGAVNDGGKSYNYYVRLVRSGQ